MNPYHIIIITAVVSFFLGYLVTELYYHKQRSRERAIRNRWLSETISNVEAIINSDFNRRTITMLDLKSTFVVWPSMCVYFGKLFQTTAYRTHGHFLNYVYNWVDSKGWRIYFMELQLKDQDKPIKVLLSMVPINANTAQGHAMAFDEYFSKRTDNLHESTDDNQ